MFDYLQKFNSLPQELRDKVSSPEVMRSILDMEAKYKVDLAALVMKVMVKSVAVDSLINYFKEELALNNEQANNLNRELRDRVLILAAEHLGLKTSPLLSSVVEPIAKPITQPIVQPTVQPITQIKIVSDSIASPISNAIKTSGIILPSSDLFNRLEKILSTYQKGIRSKIDTRASLAKKVEFGGLDLSDLEIEKLFKSLAGKTIEKPVEKIAERLDEAQDLNTPKREAEKMASKARLDRIIMQSEAINSLKPLTGEEKEILAGYDLKKSIEAMKKPLEENIKTAETIKKPFEKIDLTKLGPRKTFVQTKKLEASEELEALPLEVEEFLLSAPMKKENSVQVAKPATAPELVKVPELVQQEELVKNEEHAAINLPLEAKIEKTPIKSEIVPDEPKKANKFSEPKEDVEQLPVNLNFRRPEPLSTSSKPRIQDIKPVPKIMSPIEELQFLDLVNFRRLGVNAIEITDKVFAKIKLLERDGYDKMVQGVAAWRKSEANRLYLKIGQEAVMGGVSMKDAILNRQKANKPHLTLEEIEAISKLNSRLSF